MKTICIDFDGVIHNYKKFKGKGIFGPSINGAKKYIGKLKQNGWTVIIHTTREEKSDIERYLIKHNIPFDHFNCNPENNKLKCSKYKPIADVYLDDRAICFEGEWSERLFQKILSFAPHYEKVRIEKTVADLIEEAAQTFKMKNKDYGNSFNQLGKLMTVLFPKGVTIKTEEEFNKFGILIQIVHKLARYANLLQSDKINFESIQDTLKDLGIYSFMGAFKERQ